MERAEPDFLGRTVEYVILTILSAEPMHCLGIEQQFDQKTRGLFRKHRPSFPVTLIRLERAGWVEAEWRQVEDLGRVQVYSLSLAGKAHLEVERTERRAAVAQYFGCAGLIGNFKRSDPTNWN